MGTGDNSFDEILNGKPTLAELCKHVPISTNLYIMGTQLELDVRKLNEIIRLVDITYKNIWLRLIYSALSLLLSCVLDGQPLPLLLTLLTISFIILSSYIK